MKREYIDKIKSYYDKAGEFKLNDRYSGEQGAVYTKDGDKYHWLVLEQKGKSGMEVRQTDGHGRITARDSYEGAKNTVKCTGVERLKAVGKGMVSFSADEINLICQFGENGREGTLANLKGIEPGITDAVTKEIVGTTILKLSGLSEKSCIELISTTKNRKTAERDSSIRERLAKAKEQIKRPTINGEKKREQPKKEGMEL